MSAPRLAATVILARPGAGGFELYMTRRSSGSAFAPDAFVFPGGTIDGNDQAAAADTLGLESDRLIAIFRGSAEVAAAALLCVAAVRELFEEAGVLLATTPSGERVDGRRLLDASVRAERERLCDGSLSFAAFLRERGWRADARPLVPLSRWITPESEPRRYDTYFFLAIAPPEQAASADAFETHDGIWIAPRAALERYRDGSLHLVYPTIKHLERLAPFDSLDALAEFARTKEIKTAMPNEGSLGFVLPPGVEDAW